MENNLIAKENETIIAILDDDGYISSYAEVGGVIGGLEYPKIENMLGKYYKCYKYVDDEWVFDESKKSLVDKERQAMVIRFRRDEECFPVINRGGIWYDTLTKAEKDELLEWYQAWLDAPETGIIPEKPSWLK